MVSVEKSLLNRTLTISVADGVTASGAAKLKNRSFGSINAEAGDEALYGTAKALGGLMAKPMARVTFSERNLLEEVENA